MAAAISVFCALGLASAAPAQTVTGIRSLITGLSSRPASNLKASFTYGPRYPLVDHSVQFTDTSTGIPQSWLWDFGDGGRSTARNPLHCFTTTGFKKVTLTITSASGSKTIARTLSVLAAAATASFVFSPTTPGPGQAVQFADTTPGTPSSWRWDFGDGSSSTAKNPSHVYLQSGTYNVTLAVSLGSGVTQVSHTVVVSAVSILQSSFYFSPALPQIGQSVQFTDTSVGSPTSWRWNFGDGGTSSAQNPSHVYLTAGSKTVTLTSTAGSHSNTTTRTLQVSNATAASFTYSPGSPAPGETIQFTDTSTGNPTSWFWDFNDSSTSTLQNPSHVFGSAGSYNVTLTASDGAASQSASRTITVASDDGSLRQYWVSPTGAATWVNAKSSSPLSGAACCSLATANANAAAGDTVILRGGSYYVNTHGPIKPSRSGTLDSRITYKACPGENPEFLRFGDNTNVDQQHAVQIIGKSYIVIDGIAGTNLGRWLLLQNGACFNEIKNCHFSTVTFDCAIRIWDATGAPSTDNWLHHNIFERVGYVAMDGQDKLSLLQIGTDGVADNRMSRHNTLEDNVIAYGGHDASDIYTKYNVIKRNFYHNEGWMTAPAGAASGYAPDANGKYGNRNLAINSSRTAPGEGVYDLLEANRFGASGASCDDDGGDALTIIAMHCLVRYNEVLNGQNNGILLKVDIVGSASYNKIYNNTIVWNGRYDNSYKTGFSGVQWQGAGIRYYPSLTTAVGTCIKNNLLFGNAREDIEHRVWPAQGTDTYRDNSSGLNWLNAQGDPLFMDATHSDLTSPTQPDLRLTAVSGCIDAGTHLVLAKGGGSASTTLVVKSCDVNGSGNPVGAANAALYFQDGTWGSALTHGVTLFPDWIAIGTVTNVVQIASIDYSTNTIRLASPMTWNADDKIWLYKDSSGRIVLNGAAPDLGAHESDRR
jgi:PKD repeat protein